MTIEAGEKMPPGTFVVMTGTGPAVLSTDELFTGKRVILVSVPGAFTPTCSAKHLPGFLQYADELRARGVDTIAFTAVNDVWVMDAWGKDQGVGDDVLMLADGNGQYVDALGLAIDSTAFDMGVRGRRFAIVVDEGTATHVAIDQPGQFEASKAEAVLALL